MNDQNDRPDDDRLKQLAERADRLEQRAREDGVLPTLEEEGDGIGPQTGVVP
ncbi:hypothetical protein SH203_01886 [Brevundimonas sp. SH203]|uniref:hypothetical protein n=1 Tax=Brevundimonas sp. SH203 TaxID=345167 RepID=UPI0009C8422C|nr:hypothetical protein [Brevundimonas sp. SH203]GAW41480.1 hypothetical protein SH203_01886 [Brevundimonas sp. SH203]